MLSFTLLEDMAKIAFIRAWATLLLWANFWSCVRSTLQIILEPIICLILGHPQMFNPANFMLYMSILWRERSILSPILLGNMVKIIFFSDHMPLYVRFFYVVGVKVKYFYWYGTQYDWMSMENTLKVYLV